MTITLRINIIRPVFTCLFLFCISIVSSGQNNRVKGSISSTDTATLTVLNIYPDSFPDVAVVFRAETKKGQPVWNLTKEKMQVKENAQDCRVVSLEPVSKNKPINLGIVIDHSGSMSGGEFVSYDQDGNMILPNNTGRPTPLDHAKSAVKKFIHSFNAGKDYISITGFSEKVDAELPLTKDIGKMEAVIKNMQANGITALYDAMISSLNQVHQANGLKVLVALTDGHDNNSTATPNNVIETAKKFDIPVYIVGLGNVNADTLKHIAESANGQLFLTRSSQSLSDIYEIISNRILAFYNLVYQSPNFASADSARSVELSFDVDSIHLETNAAAMKLPPEVTAFLRKKETKKQYLLYGGVALAVLIAAGTLLFYYKRKQHNDKNRTVIKKIYPNPANSVINIEFESAAGVLKIINMHGQTVKTFPITGGETQFNLSDTAEDSYVAVIVQANGQQSNSYRFMIQR